MRNIARYVAVAGLYGALAGPVAAQQQPQSQGQDRVSIAFSDPNRPGSLDMDLVMGSITVRGTNRKDVLIDAQPRGGNGARQRRNDAEPPAPGLRRLTQGGAFSVEEEKNVVKVDIDVPTRSFDFVIEVPVRTNLHLETVMGTILVEGVDGDLEIDSVNGPVTLTNVAGSVVAHSVNGKLLATITRATAQKPMAFTSLNGAVDVTLPASLKANLKLRSDRGDVFTDFDLQLRPGGSPASVDDQRPRGGRYRVEVDKAIYGSVNGGGPDFEMRTFNGNVYVRKGK